MKPHYHPSPRPIWRDIETTDEMRDKALAKTGETMRKLDDVRKRLELPAELLPLVAMTYEHMLLEEQCVARERQAETMAHDMSSAGAMNFANPEIMGAWGQIVGDLPSHAKLNEIESNLAGLRPGHRKPIKMRSMIGDCVTGLNGEPLPIKGAAYSAVSELVAPNTLRCVTVRPQTAAFRVEDIQIIGNPKHWKVCDINVGNRSQYVTSGELDGVAFDEHGVCRNLMLDTCQTAMGFTLIVRYVGPNPEGEPFEATVVGLSAS